MNYLGSYFYEFVSVLFISCSNAAYKNPFQGASCALSGARQDLKQMIFCIRYPFICPEIQLLFVFLCVIFDSKWLCSVFSSVGSKRSVFSQDEDTACFRDIRPGAPHHYIVVPKRHVGNCKSLRKEHIPLGNIAIGTFFLFL